MRKRFYFYNGYQSAINIDHIIEIVIYDKPTDDQYGEAQMSFDRWIIISSWSLSKMLKLIKGEMNEVKE